MLLSTEFNVTDLCEILGISRSAYYAYIKGDSHVLKNDKAELSKVVLEIFAKHKRRYGWRRIQGDLEARGFKAGRHQIRSRMREQNLVAIQPKSLFLKQPKATRIYAVALICY